VQELREEAPHAPAVGAAGVPRLTSSRTVRGDGTERAPSRNRTVMGNCFRGGCSNYRSECPQTFHASTETYPCADPSLPSATCLLVIAAVVPAALAGEVESDRATDAARVLGEILRIPRGPHPDKCWSTPRRSR
jgi:hypothetical protein